MAANEKAKAKKTAVRKARTAPRAAAKPAAESAAGPAVIPAAAAPSVPGAEVNLKSSRRFWLAALAVIVVALGIVQTYGYLTGWGNPERVIQRRFNTAQRLTLARRYEAAVKEYTKILNGKTSDDNQRQALIGIADLRREQKQYPQAIELYQRLRDQDPNNVLSAWAGLQIGDIQLEAGTLDAAEVSYADVSKRFPNSDWDAEARLGQGKVLEKQERYAEAIAVYDGLVKTYAGGFLAAEALVHVGQCRELTNDPAAARRAYQEVLEKYPSSTWDEAKQRLQRLEAGPEKPTEGVRVWGEGK